MKAALFLGPERMEVRKIETPSVNHPWEMLVRVKACSICGSDVRIFHHGNPRVRPPAILGHEIAGEVVEVGEAITQFKVGDRVAIGADVPCGICEMCRRGLGNNCPINYAIGYQFPGGFAEFILLNETTMKYGPVHKIPDGVNDIAATLAEPIGCCLNAYELANLSAGETVVVFGLGPVGCLLVELAKVLGAGKVIAIQRSRKRLEMAIEMGIPADVFICSSEEDPVKRVLEETEGEGADVILTAGASEEAQEQAIRMVAHRGRVNLFAGLPPGSRKIEFDSNFIHYREAFIFGSHGSVPRHHKAALKLLADGRIKAERYFTHFFALDEILEAIKAVKERKAMKAVIRP
ncbi:MAG: alcohol dehydrogenase catalytic domain-containing protein [Armatimonadetes bacterium]|nr:alcohol dehydrogenase catalytic domain-containing protein [Armatimonadota bacterium]